MNSPQPTDHAKVSYFQLLSSLNGPATDHDDDLGEWEQRDRQRRRRFFKSCPSPEIPSRASKDASASGKGRDGALRRVLSAPDRRQPPSAQVIANTQSGGAAARKGRLGALLDTEPGDADETIVPDSTRPAHKALRRSDSTPMMPTKKLPLDVGEPSPSLGVGLRKRKRGSDTKLCPETEQIFKDLAFFYIPDNDIAPARRLRIAKAREYGALWTRSLSAATHIVVDKNLGYNDVDKVTCTASLTRLPKLVNEDYPIDCIQFRSLLDPDQRKYRIAGQPEATAGPQPKVTATPSKRAESLQLKPKHDNQGRRSRAPQPSTPLRDDGSSQRSVVDATPAPTGPQPLPPDKGHGPEHVPERDELAVIINIMQEFKHLPLDKDDDEDARSDSGQSVTESRAENKSDAETDEMRGLEASESPLKPGRKTGKFEDRFACHQGGERDANADNPNARTIEVLQNMASYYDRINDHWRTTGYRKAINTLERQDVKIRTEEEAFRLPHIGRRIAQKIEEIATTDRLRRLEYAEDEATDGALQLFLRIHGVGTNQARQWIAQGHRTLNELVRQVKLTPSQMIGIEHYDDLATRIPRREVEALGAVVRQAAARVDPAVELIIGGSYRRGADSSHDIDLIVTKSGTTSLGELRPFLDSLVGRLEKDEFLVARLASSRTGRDGSTWQGCCVLPRMAGVDQEGYRAVWRRIDFLLVPEAEMGGALIYFTGNDIFNRSMRLLARKKGMRLNQRGLYRDVLPGPRSSRACEGELVEGRVERRIFEVLGVRWREPHERWC
ncbi:DNA polymerase beta palm domain-containing protein [Hirsutella rhossiliensis]|uniref:DNA polymerase lambda n=1 Tax=Hirsutella rhossiliensis TaxID=111463 RepID=A0A9P8SMT2_9HYPO|nr:DNA polymerase beta palm domain-containing protein [Hirsutella rhossiliensis]KAH0967190.1 DNA polymerase beta palm domain-containing protein [Hirsutella rhossiliensis]